jgi:hypothetical protein
MYQHLGVQGQACNSSPRSTARTKTVVYLLDFQVKARTDSKCVSSLFFQCWQLYMEISAE